ncbi:phosphate propanoyltransferase [Oceanirhabdus seepicola]|uniref:Phosphate propanoyltransferase n=1 Tax=Oceanirhabdus seepicola TaxID=2828781 RepID=A0A9J6P5Z4_9CLOT|nr:phosphate propanoyltransferase [Oceanirhabdus seepicola]MCM1991237.1 phosphate propanoyltransferase [Oceanirhabdus seepicola]
MDNINSKVDYIVDEVIKRITKNMTIPVEISGRHVHLSKESVDILFGEGYELTSKRELSQPGQYLCHEKVTLIGPNGSFHNVAVLGPTRSRTQVEISKTDSRLLGVKAPVRESGDIKESASIVISGEKGVLMIQEGVIVAKRHLHITPEDAKRFQVKDKELIGVEIISDRSMILKNVVVRVNENYKTRIHMDYDEGNACSYEKGTVAKIIKYEGNKL